MGINETANNLDALLTPAEAARQLGVSVKQIGELADDGALPFVNVGRGLKRPARRYEQRDLDAFREARRKIACRSTNDQEPKHIPSTFGTVVIDFQATRNNLKNAKLKRP